jgi:hypothetical protein
MEFFYIRLLKAMRKTYSIFFPNNSDFDRNWKIISIKEYSNKLIHDALISNKPLMIARLGSNELKCVLNYLAVHYKKKNIKEYIKGKAPAWWWEKQMIKDMQEVAGFFPGKIEFFERFSEMMLEDMLQVDILGSWRLEERFVSDRLLNSKKVMLEDLEPFFVSNPWTKALKGKKVLVVHPFAETIRKQYSLRTKLFDNDLLPEFDLLTLKAVQSYAYNDTSFKNWFEALEWMKKEIDNIDYDICILGCGAYGFPLAAHVKRMGKKAIHLGGITQFLFGIKGRRWENYIVYPYTNLYNEYWVRPGENEKPTNVNLVEGGCYW